MELSAYLVQLESTSPTSSPPHASTVTWANTLPLVPPFALLVSRERTVRLQVALRKFVKIAKPAPTPQLAEGRHVTLAPQESTPQLVPLRARAAQLGDTSQTAVLQSPCTIASMTASIATQGNTPMTPSTPQVASIALLEGTPLLPLLAQTARQASTMAFLLKGRALLVEQAATRPQLPQSLSLIAGTASLARQTRKKSDPLTVKNVSKENPPQLQALLLVSSAPPAPTLTPEVGRNVPSAQSGGTPTQLSLLPARSATLEPTTLTRGPWAAISALAGRG
mmetsp:Transcript_13987/g.28596  ORF Transcript_13987/g.28596 Transcript_13987/m.28596 type:complete len:280 (-) Transcript_13987:115-954(-)